MINFSTKEKTNPYLLSKEEAEMFCLFLYQEINRHQQDIEEGRKLIRETELIHNLDIATLFLLKTQRCEPDCKFVLYGVKCRGCHYD